MNAEVQPSSSASATLRLIWPQWQGAGADVVQALMPEVALQTARRGYSVGTSVLTALLPDHGGPTVTVPVSMDDTGLEERDGVEAKDAVLRQLRSALTAIDDAVPEKIMTIGGECSVSVAPFTYLASRYPHDLAVIWLDSHPDVGTPASAYRGYHAMAVAMITGHGDADLTALLPAAVDPAKVALTGLHSWTEDDFPNASEWGVATFSPENLRASSQPLLAWLASTGCSKVAIHLDVDVVDSDEVVLGLGMEPQGLTTSEVRRIVGDVSAAADVVGLTIAEYIPRQVIRMAQFVDGFPLI